MLLLKKSVTHKNLNKDFIGYDEIFEKSKNEITDSDIRYFIHDAFKIAVDKAENEITINELTSDC